MSLAKAERRGPAPSYDAHQVLDLLADGVLVVDPAGTIVDENAEARRLLGGSLLGRRLDSALRPAGRMAISRSLAEGAPLREERATLVRCDGKGFAAAYSFRPGSPGTLLFRDVSDLARVEDALRASTTRLTTLVDSVPAGLLVEDERGTVVHANRELARLFGVSDPAELVGGPFWEVIERATPLMAEPLVFVAAIERLAAARVPVRGGELELSDGRIFERDYVPITTADQYRGALWSVRDVTPAKRIQAELEAAKQQAESANRAKDAFLATMSHEIRTPMTNVIGSTELLLDQGTSPEQAHVIDGIRRSGQQLLEIIDGILDYTRIGCGKLELRLGDLELRELFCDVVAAQTGQARFKGLDVSLSVDDELPRWVRADAFRLRQVLNNLLSNAIKFTERGGVKVVVEQESALLDGGCLLRCTVSDTGIGIEPESVKELFEPFAQGDASMARRFGGTGLGLSIARQLVELMGGRIGASGELGRGASFWFSVPLAPGTETVGRACSSRPRSVSPLQFRAGGIPRVLVAEDNPFNRALVERTLEGLGCRVTAVETGRSAVQAARAEPHDLILMDCQMPDMDGIEATKMIREQEDSERRAQIIALTANALHGDRERCLAAGMDDHIAKPFSVEGLRRRVKAALDADQSAEVEPAKPSRKDVGQAEGAKAVRTAAQPRPALDFERLDMLEQSSGSDGLVAELAQIFIEDTHLRLQAVERAMAEGDAEGIGRAAHALRGSAVNFGAERLAELAGQLERQTKVDDAWLKDAARALAEVKQALVERFAI